MIGSLLLMLQSFFNENVKAARVTVEHAFGILKGRWRMLKNANLRVKTESDEALAMGLIQAACMLHNLTVDTWDTYIDLPELRELLAVEESIRQRALTEQERRYDSVRQTERRRERLIDQMVELLPGEDVGTLAGPVRDRR